MMKLPSSMGPLGKENSLTTNRPARYRIELNSGTYFEFTLPIGGRFLVCDFGDVKSYDVYFEDELSQPTIVRQEPSK
jgi:hypothetical protein